MGPIHAEHYHFDCFDAGFGLDGCRGGGEAESPVSTGCTPSSFYFSLC